MYIYQFNFFFSSRRRHTRSYGDWSSDVCSSDLKELTASYIERIKQLDSKLNSFVTITEDRARVEAERVDLEIEHGKIGRASCRERIEKIGISGIVDKKVNVKQRSL